MEEMETRRQLQEEVEDLRTRIGILMEKAQLALDGDGDESCIIV
jgi:phage shock protein A